MCVADAFGIQLRKTLETAGIDTSKLYEDREVHTTLAFVHTLPDGDREFSFYRNPGADMMLVEEEVTEEYIRQAKVIHFGTISMTHDGVRNATKKAVELAKKNGLLITFDPNLRPPLWESLESAKEQMEYGFSQCDVLKISDNELQFASGKEDYDEGICILQEKYKIPLIFLTLGKKGSCAYYAKENVWKKKDIMSRQWIQPSPRYVLRKCHTCGIKIWIGNTHGGENFRDTFTCK